MNMKSKTGAPDETGARFNSSRPTWTLANGAVHRGKNKQNCNWQNSALLLLTATAVWLQPCLAPATILTVTSLGNGGIGSLRNTTAGSDANDTITFSLTGTITLTSQIVIDHNLTLIAPVGPPGIFMQGSENARAFSIASGASVNFSNLTLSAFYTNASGGAIYNSGSLTLNNCSLTHNSAVAGNGGAIQNSGTLTVNNCTFSSNKSYGTNGLNFGGAINNAGTLSVSNCLFSSNNSGGVDGPGHGGAIATAGVLTANNSTFDDNSCGDTPYLLGYGGGLYYDGVALTINNCTFYQNSCLGTNEGYGGGMYFNVYGGGGGIRNSIIASNYAKAGPDALGLVPSSGYNFVGKTDGSSGWVVSDLKGTIASPRDPQLGPLHNNGGPTFTMLPSPTSPVLDAGDDNVLSTLATDQRGRPRRTGNHVDIGAVESGRITLGVRNLAGKGPGSLRQAILDASPVESDIIAFDPSLTGTIALDGGELLIDKSLSIIGPGANLLMVSGNRTNRVFNITNGPTVIANLSIADGYSLAGGGGIAVEGGGCVTVSNCTIRLLRCGRGRLRHGWRRDLGSRLSLPYGHRQHALQQLHPL